MDRAKICLKSFDLETWTLVLLDCSIQLGGTLRAKSAFGHL